MTRDYFLIRIRYRWIFVKARLFRGWNRLIGLSVYTVTICFMFLQASCKWANAHLFSNFLRDEGLISLLFQMWTISYVIFSD